MDVTALGDANKYRRVALQRAEIPCDLQPALMQRCCRLLPVGLGRGLLDEHARFEPFKSKAPWAEHRSHARDLHRRVQHDAAEKCCERQQELGDVMQFQTMPPISKSVSQQMISYVLPHNRAWESVAAVTVKTHP